MDTMQAVNRGLERRYVARPTAAAALVCALLAAGSVKPCLAGSWSQTVFGSPDEASRALTSAVEEHDERAITKILGGGSDLIRSDDGVEDSLDRERFVQKYREMHRWIGESGGIATLYIGAENWPFPIPLVSRNGKWRFDPQGGSDEILFRRIGENEVTAIRVCDTLVAARARPGADGEADRLVQTLLRGQDAGRATPLHGYYFHILPSSSGGVAFVAYPAMYRSSGVMTFIVMHDGAVSEKDLGPDTAKIAGAMTGHEADATWTPVGSTR
jgi:Protein of unknown function (DUF2950)